MDGCECVQHSWVCPTPPRGAPRLLHHQEGVQGNRLSSRGTVWFSVHIACHAQETLGVGVHDACHDREAHHGYPPWRQPRGNVMVSLVNSHTNATRIVHTKPHRFLGVTGDMHTKPHRSACRRASAVTRSSIWPRTTESDPTRGSSGNIATRLRLASNSKAFV